jgi:molybdopterin molybdotransferase
VFVPAITRHALNAGGQRETYLWGRLEMAADGYSFELAGGGHISGNLINLAGTNALAIVPVGTQLIPAGETVRVMVVN